MDNEQKGEKQKIPKSYVKNYKRNLSVPLTLHNFINWKQSTKYFEVLTQVQGVPDLQTPNSILGPSSP